MAIIGIPIHSLAYFQTGWEFPQSEEAVYKLGEYLDVSVVTLKPAKSFEHWMLSREIRARKGPLKGQIHRIGNGWPSPTRRWCTRIKVDALEKYTNKVERETGIPSIQCIGYAYDEQHRLRKTGMIKKIKKGIVKFPLIENKITEVKALEICYKHGFNFGGLYRYFKRVSCFCCPLQGDQELRVLRKYFPYYWEKMLEMDARRPEHNRGFKKYYTVHDYDRIFALEDRTIKMYNDERYGVMAPAAK